MKTTKESIHDTYEQQKKHAATDTGGLPPEVQPDDANDLNKALDSMEAVQLASLKKPNGRTN